MLKWIKALLAELDRKAKLAAEYEAHLAKCAMVY